MSAPDGVVEFLANIQPLAWIAFFSALSGLIFTSLAEFGWWGSPEKRRDILSLTVLLFALGVLGAAAGLAGGRSREGVVGDIIPAAFVFMGGGAAYIFGVDRSRGGVVAVCCAVFAIALFAGYEKGTTVRNFSDEQRELRTACLKALTDGNFTKDTVAFDRFWKLMDVQTQGTAVALGHPEIQSGNRELRAKANLCAVFVNQWDIPSANYHWNIESVAN